MRKPLFSFKALGLAAIFPIIIVGVGFYINNIYNNLADEVIYTNKILCEVIAKQLYNNAIPLLNSFESDYFMTKGYENNRTANKIDSALSIITEKELTSTQGVEGGFYFLNQAKFQGYAYPTSPPPKPAYGPPPRSYSIIQNQIFDTVNRDSVITQLHIFDPAVFPLATVPVKFGNQLVGAVWVRTHIERELPRFDLKDILILTGVVSFLGFIITIFFSAKQKRRLDTIRRDLEKLEYEPKHRVREFPGIFGFIARSTNQMVDALQTENKKRELLEKELHQKDKMASIGQLIAGVAHEVKTPLAIIKTRIQIWQQKIINKPNNVDSNELISNDSMQLVINEINRLSNLVNRLLIFSKPVADSFIITDINNLINDVLKFFQTIRYKEKADIHFNAHANLSEIAIDPNKIEQVLLNIITNAYEAIENKGEILITTSQNNKYVIIEISDSGNGISKDSCTKIFDPFYSTKATGTGLGLSIANEIIIAHKGKIELQSNIGEGSTFSILLPLKQKTTKL